MKEAVAVVLLAAGQGTRFGAKPKLLASLDGRPLVRHAAEAARASRAAIVLAVLGAHANLVREALEGLDIRFIVNGDHAVGLATSLRAGLAALPEEIRAAIVLLGDMPRVSTRHLNCLIEAYYDADPRPCAVVPVCDGVRGNPVLLDLHSLAPHLGNLTGDRGAGALLATRSDVLEIAMDEAVLRDIDTPDALHRLKDG